MNERLKREIKSAHLGHAYLLYGKAELVEGEALDFAMAINCRNPQDGAACGVCRHCLQIKSGNFPDLVVLAPEGVYYKVDQLKTLRKYFSLTGKQGLHRIFLLQKADMMKEECADRLLKALEEPAENTVFLLTAENEDRILPTVASRCRIIRILSENKRVTDAEREEVFSLLAAVKSSPLEYLFRTAEKYAKEREKCAPLFETAVNLFSENYLYRRGGATPAHRFPEEHWSEDQLFDLWQWALAAPILMESNINLKLITENFLLRIKRKDDLNGNCSWYTL